MIFNQKKNLHKILNFLLPKRPNKVIFFPWPNTESGSIALANTLAEKKEHLEVFYLINPKDYNPKKLLHDKVKIVYKKSKLDFRPLLHLYSSKFVFFTHGYGDLAFNPKQILINLWHGLLYKKVGMLLGGKPVHANYTVGTGSLSQTMFAKAFGVKEETVLPVGYPRNDLLYKGKKNKIAIKEKLTIHTYNKIILWMPTYRKSIVGDIRIDGTEVNNPFYIENFDPQYFNSILKKHNTLCLLKPHPMAPKYDTLHLSNLKIIDDKWIYDHDLDLYEFVGTTDILISDISSIIIDYMLLDQPILCMSEDFEQYKNSRGFYFENIEEMIPTKVLTDKEDFLNSLEYLLADHNDPFENKRIKLKKEFFIHEDGKSTERLLNFLFP